jgi:hypothetical protein
MTANDAARGRELTASGKHAPPRGEYLGRIETWGLDVFEGSPQPWIDALRQENARGA